MYKPLKINRITIRVVLFWLMIQFLSSVVMATEEYTSVYVDGIAPITIDGDLSDWEWIESEWWSLDFVYTSSKPGMPESDDDLSAKFTCFGDSLYLYVAVNVVDDTLCWGHELFEQGFMDDSVEIYFDGDVNDHVNTGYDKNEGYIRVTFNNNEEVFLEGIPMLRDLNESIYPNFYREQYPYIWKILGIKSMLLPERNGYCVEVAIPLRLFGWDEWAPAQEMGLHIIVNDDDDGNNRESKIGWVTDKDNTTWKNTKLLRKIIFSMENPLGNNMGLVENVTIENESEKQAAIDLLWVLQTLPEVTYEKAIEILEERDDELWALYMKGMVQRFANNLEESEETLIDFLSKEEHENLKMWTCDIMGFLYDQQGEYQKSIECYELVLDFSESNNASFSARLNALRALADMEFNRLNYNKMKPYVVELIAIDQENFFKYLTYLERAGCYDEAFYFYSKYEYTTENEIDAIRASLGKARIYYYKKEYMVAGKIAYDIAKNGPVETRGSANMILMSINNAIGE